MPKPAAPMKKQQRALYTDACREEALLLAERVGVTTAARHLGLQPSQIYQWRTKTQQRKTVTEREQDLADENARPKRQAADMAKDLAIAKKAAVRSTGLRKKPDVKYAFIQQHHKAYRIRRMCAFLCVARSGYYTWRKRVDEASPRRRQQAETDQRVAEASHHRKGRSGAPRLVLDLKEDGVSICRNTVAASLRWQGLRAKAARKFKATTHSKHSLPEAPNLLDQDFDAKGPNQKWVRDITYLGTDQAWLYLAFVIDLFSRRIIGWATSSRMKADLVC